MLNDIHFDAHSNLQAFRYATPSDRQTDTVSSESLFPNWRLHKTYVTVLVINQSGHNVPTSGSALWEVRAGSKSLMRRGNKKWHWCWVISRDVGRGEASSSDKVEKKPLKQVAWDIHIYSSKESQITGQKTAVTFTPNRNRQRRRPNVFLWSRGATLATIRSQFYI
jgi:hypothetical protein